MIDLHLHLDGSLSPEDVLCLAKAADIRLPREDAESLRPLLEVTPDCRNLGEYLEKFDLPLQVLQREETVAQAVYLLLGRLAEQGLIYGEIRFAPQLHLLSGLTQQQVVAAAAKGLERGIAEFGMPAQLILCCMRGDANLAANLETIRVAKEFLGKGVCAVDLAGNEAAYPTEDFTAVFSLAREMQIPIIIHAGEAAGAESVRQALKLGAKRIGHGIRSVEDSNLLGLLANRQTPLELCYTSNLQTKAVEETAYPICRLLNAGISITINTDNMTVSGTNLHREYTLLRDTFGLTEQSLQAIACNAAGAAFAPIDVKEKLKGQIAEAFTGWLNQA